MQPGLVSIMMPAYNAAKFIGPAIESVLRQTYPAWELIVVDDGSTDDTAQIVRRYEDSRIRLISQTNGGEAAARNTALRYLDGEFTAFLDADDLYLPEHLQITVDFLRSHPERDAVYIDGYFCDAEGIALEPISSHRRGPFEGNIYAEMVRAPDVLGPGMSVVVRSQSIVRRNLRFDVGCVIGADWDFFVRYSETAQFGFLLDRTCLYRVHGSNITKLAAGSRRAASMARCRAKAIKMAAFGRCPLDVRYAAFYDLLVNLLSGDEGQQSAVVRWLEFGELPAASRASLLRLMAVGAMIAGSDGHCIGEWLRQSRRLNRADWRTMILSIIYALSPALCRSLLVSKARLQRRDRIATPFGDVDGKRT